MEKRTTPLKITGLEENVHKKARDKNPKTVRIVWEKESRQKGERKRKGTNECQCIRHCRHGELSITSSESINFSCYEMSEMVEWFLDSGCTDDITPRKSNFVQYRELGQLHKAEIADGKYLMIEGYGMVIGHSKMPHKNESMQI